MEKRDFGDRSLDMAVRIMALVQSLPKTMIGRHISQQLLRSGTSAGANYCEARGAESRADFAHKMQIVVKELRETQYWMELCKRSRTVKPSRLDDLAREVNELIAIGVKSVITAKSKMNG